MKLLASDFDNTLSFHGKYKEKDIKAIQEWKKQGYKFGLCSGRSVEWLMKPLKKTPIKCDFYITLSGSQIYDDHGNLLFSRKIPGNLAKKMIKDIHEDVHIIQNGKTIFQTRHFFKTLKKNIRRIRRLSLSLNLAFKIDEEIDALAFHCLKEEDAFKVTQYINSHYDEVIAYYNGIHVDVVAKGCSKRQGMDFIKNYFHLTDDDIYCIGDNYNDLPMLDSPFHSYTFHSSPQDIQEVCEDSVDFIADVIDKNI